MLIQLKMKVIFNWKTIRRRVAAANGYVRRLGFGV